MKRTITSLLLLSALLLSACGAETEPPSAQISESSAVQETTQAQPEETAAETAPEEDDQPGIPGTPVMENETGFPDLMSFSSVTLDGQGYGNLNFGDADVTVINLWGTFCGPCISEMPELAAFDQSLPDNVQLITCCVDIADDSGIRTAKGILKDAGYTGITIMNPSGDLLDLCNQMMYVPTTVFADKDGHLLGEAIIGAGNVEENYTERINEALRLMGKAELAS